jgi:two-component system cell cycle response regulator DivK
VFHDCVLVVDDVPDACEVVCSALELEGYQVLHASSGQQAVEQANLHRPALIIMDLHMPGLDGVEATTLIKANAALRDIPIIAYTAFFDDAPSEMFAAVIPKPCSLDRLLRTVSYCLRLTDAAASPARVQRTQGSAMQT